MRKLFWLLQAKESKNRNGAALWQRNPRGLEQKKAKDSTRNDEEMGVLVSWIFGVEESSKVETEVRATLKDNP